MKIITPEQLDDLRDCARATRTHLECLKGEPTVKDLADVFLGMEITASKIENIIADLRKKK